MKLLLIGGTGVLSSAVVEAAVKQGVEVTIVNRGKKKTTIPEGVSLIKADYRDEKKTKEKLSGLHFDAVIDFICYNREQIEYSINLLREVSDQYIFISTACVYNTRIPGVKDEESEKVLKEWSYSVNKWDCECFLKEQSEKYHFNYSVIRPCITYDDTRIPYGIMPPYGYHWTLCARIIAGKPVIRWNGGTTKWNMMRVEDFAIGVVGIVGNKQAYGESFNISGDNSYSWNDVLNTLANELNVKPVLVDMTSDEYQSYYTNKKGEIVGRSLDLIVSNSKIKRLVPNYTTTLPLEEGISRTIRAYKEQNFQRGIDWRYDAETDRIINKWCSIHKVDKSNFNLSFVDYLGTAMPADKRAYWIEFHKNNLFIKSGLLAAKVIKIIKRRFHR